MYVASSMRNRFPNALTGLLVSLGVVFLCFCYSSIFVNESFDEFLDKNKTELSVVSIRRKKIHQFGSYPHHKPYRVMSISKAVTSLLVSILLREGKIKSLTTPLFDYFPELNQGMKKNINIQHVLLHTTCIRNHRDDYSPTKIARNIILQALLADIECMPGTMYSYNSKATNLLAYIVEKETNMSFWAAVQTYLFGPLGLTDWHWEKDIYNNYFVDSGLEISGFDLIELGHAVIDSMQERESKKILLDENWIEFMTMKKSWIFPVENRYYWFYQELDKKILCPEKKSSCYVLFAYGVGGQVLLLIPSFDLVAIHFGTFEKGKVNDFNTEKFITHITAMALNYFESHEKEKMNDF